MKVSIIIPNWNGKKLLEKNLPAVLSAKKYKSNNIKEIIVIDDGSTDDSVRFLLKNYKKKIRIIKHTENKGFSSAVNMGARMSRSSLICLLNTDVVPEKDFLKNVIPLFTNKQIFGVSLCEKNHGPAFGYFKDGFIEHGPIESKAETRNTFWISGGSGVFKRKLWMKLGGMDEELFSPFYWEDVDLSYRAQKRGFKLLWDPSAHVIHKHESIINEKSFEKKYMNLIKERNQLLLIWKNITSRPMFKKHLQGLVTRTLHHPGYLKIIFAALKKFFKVRRARLREIKQSTVSDESIFAKFK